MKTKARALPPDPEQMNSRRAQWAAEAFEQFIQAHGKPSLPGLGETLRREIREQNLSNLLANLAHMCDRDGIDLSGRLRLAAVHYWAATVGAGIQFRPQQAGPSFSRGEWATVLHGLRMVQERADGPGDCMSGNCDHFTEAEELTSKEIDALCQRLNCGG